MLLQQDAENVFGAHMALATLLEDFQHFQARQGGLESGAFKFVDRGHGRSFWRERTGGGCEPNRYNGPIISPAFV
jgi:hypothetical protein